MKFVLFLSDNEVCFVYYRQGDVLCFFQTMKFVLFLSDNEVCFVWQYFTDQGDWRSYPPEIQKRVESEYLRRKGKGSIVIDIGNGS